MSNLDISSFSYDLYPIAVHLINTTAVLPFKLYFLCVILYFHDSFVCYFLFYF